MGLLACLVLHTACVAERVSIMLASWNCWRSVGKLLM
jgi:hypothetical protein